MIVKDVEVIKGVKQKVNVIAENDMGLSRKKGTDKDIVQSVTIEENIIAPISKGQKLGEIIYTLDGSEVGRVNLIAEDEVSKITFFSIVTHVCENWFSMLRIE